MAITLDHTEGNSLTFDDASPAKTVTGTAPIDAGAGSYFDYVNVQIAIAFGASIDGNATVSVRLSADSGATDSDVSVDVAEVIFDAGNTKTITIQLTKFNFADIGVTNGSSAVDDITLTAKWEGAKITDS